MAFYINSITSSPSQYMVLTSDDNGKIDFFLRFLPTQNMWMYSLKYGDTAIGGKILASSPNILRNLKNVLPFGIACYVPDGFEPSYLEDFVTRRVQLYLLNSEEVEMIEQGMFT